MMKKRQKRLTWFTAGYAQVAVIFPVVVVAPRYFAKQIGARRPDASDQCFFQRADFPLLHHHFYTYIAASQAVTERLQGFEWRLLAIHESARAPRHHGRSAQRSCLLSEASIFDLPGRNPTLARRRLRGGPRRGRADRRATGAGKSTLLRAIAGIWLFGRGEIKLSERRILFLPQRPYLPLGALASALLTHGVAMKELFGGATSAALEKVGLYALTSQLEMLGLVSASVAW